jgi:hypothetical protein
VTKYTLIEKNLILNCSEIQDLNADFFLLLGICFPYLFRIRRQKKNGTFRYELQKNGENCNQIFSELEEISDTFSSKLKKVLDIF